MRKNLIDRLWLPAVLGLSTVVFSLVLMQSQLAQQQGDAQAATKAQALFVKNKMESELKSRIQPLQLLGERWRSRDLGLLDADDMESDTTLAMSGYPAYQATEWLDPTLHVRWVAPQSGNQAGVGQDLGADPRLREVLRCRGRNRAGHGFACGGFAPGRPRRAGVRARKPRQETGRLSRRRVPLSGPARLDPARRGARLLGGRVRRR